MISDTIQNFTLSKTIIYNTNDSAAQAALMSAGGYPGGNGNTQT
jgi:hypothetical protein